MKIKNFRHKGLKKLYEENNSKLVPANCVSKLRNMLGFIQDMEHEDELRTLPIWNAHQLTGSRANTWSLTVTRNWRLTFWVDKEPAACDVDFEDYH